MDSASLIVVGTAGYLRGSQQLFGVHSTKFIDLSSVKCSESS